MMTKRASCLLFLAIMSVLTISVSASAQAPKFLPVSEIRPGMKGTGRTVFQGNSIEDFQVEVLGVLRNYGPKQDMILARLSGGPLEKTGVVQGMSGSPVYIDGRLVGAVAFAFPYATQSVAGIQPITQMLDVLDKRATPVPGSRAAATSPEQIVPAQTPASFVFGLLDKVRNGASLPEVLGFPTTPV